MNCTECQENLVAYLEDVLSAAEKEQVVGHLQSCPTCSQEAAEHARLRERLLADAENLGSVPLDTPVMDRILREQTLKLRKMTMRKRYARAGLGLAAAAALIAVTLSALLHESARPAYALEQTIEANRGVRFIHIKIDPARFDHLGEAWLQLDAEGQPQRMKMDYPATMDGPKVVTWQDNNRAEVWFKRKKCVGVFHDPKIVASFPTMLKMFDPKQVIEELYKAQAEGKVALETKMPAAAGEPITLTATMLPGKGHRTVYLVDPGTKLVTRVQMYSLEGKEYLLASTWDYLEYNQEPDPATFELGAPADIMRIDETTQVIGLPKGDLSDEQITVQVVREFFEALIAQDYDKAGQLLSGVPGSKVQELMGTANTRFVRIVSIGEPKPQPIPGVGGTVVDCQIEIERDGVKTIETYKPAVRPVYSHRDRWNIHGI